MNPKTLNDVKLFGLLAKYDIVLDGVKFDDEKMTKKQFGRCFAGKILGLR